MAEYKKQIGVAAVVAILMAASIGALAIYSFPSHPGNPSQSTVTKTLTTTQQVFTSGSTTTTSTAISFSSTIPLPQTYTSTTVSLDPRLAVTPLGSLATSTNATMVANELASSLGELPIQLISSKVPTCSDSSILCTQSTYLFQTSKYSNITVDMVSGKFYELDYFAQNYSALYNGYWSTHQYGTPPSISADLAVGNLMLQAFNLDLSNVQLNTSISGPGWQQWMQDFNGIQIANGGQVYFEVYPPTSQIIRLIIVEGTGWNLIPSSFPLQVSASSALNSTKTYATNTLHMGYITYASLSLQVVQDHLYYAATLSNQSKTYILFVSPITGQIGFPE